MIIFYLIVLFIAFLGVVLTAILLLWEFFAIFATDSPFISIPENITDEIIKNLKLKNGDVFYDLGCGNGNLLIKAVHSNQNIKAVGIELAFLPYLISRWNTRNYKNIEIKRENIFKTDLSNADVIFAYLFPKAMDKLLPVFEAKCKSGSRLVSCDYEAQNYKPAEIIDFKNTNKRGRKLFIYQKL